MRCTSRLSVKTPHWAFNAAPVRDETRSFGEALKPIDVVPQDVSSVFLNRFGNGFVAARKRQGDDSDGG